MGNKRPEAVILQFNRPTQVSLELSVEAAALETREGKNPYSDYLLKHGNRPAPDAATAMGQLMGVRVKASNGKKYPRLSNAARDIVRTKKAHFNKLEHVWRLRSALLLLGENEDNQVSVTDSIWPSDEAVISANLEKAVAYLARFAEEWHSRVSQTDPGQTSDEGPRTLFEVE